jgi:hypothetical protein
MGKNILMFESQGRHSHLGKNFQTEAIIGAMEDNILLDRLNRMGTWSRMQDHIIMAWK